jgi:hypothetical protein
MFGRDKPLKASKREAHSKISIPLRAVEDDHVDRRSVYAWQHVQPNRTNSSCDFPYRAWTAPIRGRPGRQ